ncbi:fungal-specific transcription factor domain-containing protein [Amylocarpus encephaloides]|uniref:Fungal-specific transcription factor domain-containing protein n=1 Tax=Amylocarpus encephaloides TaxID=45428 RepID=A0A9P8C5L1_9HELO|nr:fungal-specific transcription factor domain-containing protein [Amylocarpus encephaloides]
MPAHERHRTSLACARCYQRKKKCDKRTPSCSSCLQARQPCIAINRQKDIEVPRSVVQYLEQVLGQLIQARPNTPRASTTRTLLNQEASLQSTHFRTSNPQGDYPFVIHSIRRAVTSILNYSLLRGQPGMYHRNRLFYGSEAPPLKVNTGVHQEKPYYVRGIFSPPLPLEPDPLLVPFEVAKLLLDVFIERILPRYPCYMEWELIRHFDSVYPKINWENGQSPPSDMSRFIVDMVLAISALTSKAHDFRKIASLSESLHRDALRHYHILRHSNIDTLRCFLLLIQHALLLPHAANLWYMTGEATRMAIALGLHQETAEPIQFDMADLRRRIFWTTYILERTVTVTSGCPVAIAEDQINVKLPTEYEDICISSTGLKEDKRYRRNKTQFLDLIRFRRLQSDIHAVQFFGQKLPESSLDYNAWVMATDEELQNWLQHASSSHKTIPDWFENAVSAMRLMLHRPCRRNPIPSDTSMKEVVETAISVVSGCSRLGQTGYLIYPLHNVYNGFHSGLVLLFALKHRAEIFQSSNLYLKVVESLELLTNVFASLPERWPAAINTACHFNDLKARVLLNVEMLPGSTIPLDDVDLVAELDHLVTERQTNRNHHSSSASTNQTADITGSPEWLHTPFFSFGMDEAWESFMNMGFSFDNLDSLYYSNDLDSISLQTPAVTPPVPTSVHNEASEDSFPLEKLESIIGSIPACNSCRNRRIKCSREIPICRNCMHSGKPCLYYDTILAKDISGSYIHELYTKIRNEPSRGIVDDTVLVEPPQATLPAKFYTAPIRTIFVPNRRNIEVSMNGIVRDSPVLELDTTVFGASSSAAALVLAISIRPDAMYPTCALDDDIAQLGPELADQQFSPQSCNLPPYQVASALVKKFSHSVNLFYPTMPERELDELLSTAYDKPQEIRGTFEEQTLLIILGIASRLMRWSYHDSLSASNAYFQQGMSEDQIMHEKTSTSQVLLLQRSLLICIYLLFTPGSGDLWRNLGFSIRLYFDMVHRPSSGGESETELAVMLYRTLYCLECQVAIAYGRPSLLSICDILRDVSASSQNVHLLLAMIGN